MVQGKLETFDLLAEILFSLWAKAKHLWQGSWLLLVMLAGQLIIYRLCGCGWLPTNKFRFQEPPLAQASPCGFKCIFPRPQMEPMWHSSNVCSSLTHAMQSLANYSSQPHLVFHPKAGTEWIFILNSWQLKERPPKWSLLLPPCLALSSLWGSSAVTVAVSTFNWRIRY